MAFLNNPFQSVSSAALASVLVIVAAAFMTKALADAAPVQATLINAQQASVGSVIAKDVTGGVLFTVQATGLSPGWHGFHLHEKGLCEAPEFKSAGGHWNPLQKKHGLLNPDGKHQGDLPNLYVPNNGVASLEVLVPGITISDLQDTDGTAVVIHQGPDDYQTDPAGAAGPRIACASLQG